VSSTFRQRVERQLDPGERAAADLPADLVEPDPAADDQVLDGVLVLARRRAVRRAARRPAPPPSCPSGCSSGCAASAAGLPPASLQRGHRQTRETVTEMAKKDTSERGLG